MGPATTAWHRELAEQCRLSGRLTWRLRRLCGSVKRGQTEKSLVMALADKRALPSAIAAEVPGHFGSKAVLSTLSKAAALRMTWKATLID